MFSLVLAFPLWANSFYVFCPQETSHAESPYGEEGEGSSNSDDSDDEDAEGNLEEKGVKLEISPGKRTEADVEGVNEMESRKNHQGQTPDKNSLEGEPQHQVKETESSAGFQENDGKLSAASDQQKLKVPFLFFPFLWLQLDEGKVHHKRGAVDSILIFIN